MVYVLKKLTIHPGCSGPDQGVKFFILNKNDISGNKSSAGQCNA